MRQNKLSLTTTLLLLIAFAFGIVTLGYATKLANKPAHAASTYVVDSNGDESDDNPGDDICHTAADTCTLRAAIEEANANPGADIINFDNAYTIQPASAYDALTEPVEINGYTGSPGGATANSAISPAPFNGTLTIEIDGTNAGASNGLSFASGSTGSTVRGLVINRFAQTGIVIGVDSVTVAGNYIGVGTNGTTDQGNGGSGIYIGDGANSVVGGTNTADRNIISGNTANGIQIDSAGTTHTVAGNYIGLAANGTTAVANSSIGVSVTQTTQVTIGGSVTAAKNVISGNTAVGIYLNTVTASTVAGNYIGTSYTGAADLGNGDLGISIIASDSNTIGGTSAETRNVISGNDLGGAHFNNSDSNTVSGNYVGTNAAGTAALGNTGNGIGLSHTSANNTIGGTTAGARNIISGNDGSGYAGITTDGEGNPAGTGNLAQGNYIGLGEDGVTIIANDIGIGMFNVDGMTIGGTTTGSRNIISGNTTDGINASKATGDGLSNNLIAGNYIGTDYTGTIAKGNGAVGIQFDSGDGTGNVIGGTSTNARNIVAANGASGIAAAGGITVQGNHVGLSSDGSALGNGVITASRPAISAATGTIIGGGTPGAGNIASAQIGGAGIGISGLTPFAGPAASNITVQGNCIGTNQNCEVESGYGNATQGMSLFADVTNVLIGGTTSGAGNTIAGNAAGIVNIGFQTYTPVNVSILGNSIHSNTGGTPTALGIDNLQTNDITNWINAGVTLNDADDIDYNGTNIGTNHYLNFPEMTAVTSENGQATITYNLDINDAETGATGYRVEFFANDTADASGYGQGQTYLGSDTVSGDVTDRQATITLPAGVSGAKQISAVTIMTDNSSDGFGHSSEFAADIEADLIAAVAPTPSGSSSSLAGTGMNVYALIAIAGGLIIAGGTGTYIARKRSKSVQ